MIVLQLFVYLCVALCVIGVIARAFKYYNTPIHLRWELYPVAHEAEKVHHGGSYYEDLDWWEKPPKPSLIAELKGMLPEMIFVKGLWEHNRKLWYRSFPFHFGLYMLMGFAGLLILGAILELAGVAISAEASPIGRFIFYLTFVAGVPGMALVLLGSLGLIHRRMTDPDMADFTYFSHYFNLLLIFATALFVLLAWIIADPVFSQLRAFIAGLLTFSPPESLSGLIVAEAALAAFLVAYIPFTNLAHPIAKYFTYHMVKWDDEPNLPGGKVEKKINRVLQYPVTWAAPHVRGDGKRTWAEIATEEWKKDDDKG